MSWIQYCPLRRAARLPYRSVRTPCGLRGHQHEGAVITALGVSEPLGNATEQKIKHVDPWIRWQARARITQCR